MPLATKLLLFLIIILISKDSISKFYFFNQFLAETINIMNYLWTLILLFAPGYCVESTENTTAMQITNDTTAEIPSDSLVFAQILFRHGERNILKPYKNDPWNDEKYWAGGYAQLTQTGKQQMYELGSYLRQRYFKLLPEGGQYQVNNIYVQSTDVDRTLNSAAYALSAMFPPMNEQIWNKSLMWQAIPIHTIPKYLDYILSMDRECPLYNRAFKEYTESPEIQLMLKNNRTLFEYVEKYSGERVRTFLDLQHVHETLAVENLKNLS